MNYAPPSLHTAFFHLLTVDQLREHRSFWIKVVRLSEGKHKTLTEAAQARLRHVHNWLFFRRWQTEQRQRYPHSMQQHKRLGHRRSPPIASDFPTSDVVVAA